MASATSNDDPIEIALVEIVALDPGEVHIDLSVRQLPRTSGVDLASRFYGRSGDMVGMVETTIVSDGTALVTTSRGPTNDLVPFNEWWRQGEMTSAALEEIRQDLDRYVENLRSLELTCANANTALEFFDAIGARPLLACVYFWAECEGQQSWVYFSKADYAVARDYLADLLDVCRKSLVASTSE